MIAVPLLPRISDNLARLSITTPGYEEREISAEGNLMPFQEGRHPLPSEGTLPLRYTPFNLLASPVFEEPCYPAEAPSRSREPFFALIVC